jgi:hypothetical protein
MPVPYFRLLEQKCTLRMAMESKRRMEMVSHVQQPQDQPLDTDSSTSRWVGAFGGNNQRKIKHKERL